ncbi:adhesion G-protein coupled receptor G5-like [Cheilinus undulatus]|uniref:adhesion G-protein coupled receptor G5-like n=1 Tax=Cheilinus undulatus TaxID=241271 RepID=UPI001BD467F5|nr:adhesion G-protein coupled receptor G5-like [Cheilinus undulatus]
MHWVALVFYVLLLWIPPGENSCKKDKACWKPRDFLGDKMEHLVVADNFNSAITTKHYLNNGKGCIIFLQKNATRRIKGPRSWPREWPQLEEKNGILLLYITKWHVDKELTLTVLKGKCKNYTKDECPPPNPIHTESCQITCLQTGTVCDQASFNESFCREKTPSVTDKYIINVTETNTQCINCDNPVESPEEELGPEELNDYGLTVDYSEGKDLDPVQASNVMKKMEDFATKINTSSAALNMGEGVKGLLVRATDPEDVDEVSMGFGSTNGMSIVDDNNTLLQFPRSVTVPKEAFDQAVHANISVPFVALFRFINMTKDEKNSIVLENEVLAVEMGSKISNLTEKISLSFRNVKHEGIPSCQSWDGEGSRPVWTGDGCVTVKDGDDITCQCSHLTFFAILLTPLNETISSSDLKNLTIITQVGCSVSMLSLGTILFMHFLIRKSKAGTATKILIHLVLAMFFLNFSFLVNHHVAKLKSSVGCMIMAAVMHYFMLATFTWFAVQAFHLCLQLYSGGKVGIQHYITKVCVISWVLPGIIGVALLITRKYGEQIIYTTNPEDNVAMCWITDSVVHYIVNIGYYAVVFLFTFTTFIIILSWLFGLKKTKDINTQAGQSGRSILTILGLCCMLGITWGFAFFAYGPLLIPSYYVFTVLNSFQGFFLFIYYYNTSHLGDISSGARGFNNSASTSSINTLNTTDSNENPYSNVPVKKNPSEVTCTKR